MGRSQPEGAGVRSLVADGDRLAHLRQPGGPGRAAGEVRIADRADAGYDLQVLDNAAKPVKPGETGTLAVKLPLPPSCLPTLWNNDTRFRDSYLAEFPGYYTTSDAGYMDADGYAFVMARTDDVINVAGHRLSRGRWKRSSRGTRTWPSAPWWAWRRHEGAIPAGFIVLNAGVNRPTAEIEGEVVKLVREEIGPVAAFKTVMVVKRLPKTRSGKILRGTMRQIADGRPGRCPRPSTIRRSWTRSRA